MDGWVVWITGLPGSGKSSISNLLYKKLMDREVHSFILSMDKLRKIVTPKPSYSEDERDMVYRSLVFTAKALSETGTNVIIDATGNRRRFRDKARELIRYFIEVYVKCPLHICIAREKRRKETYGAPRNIFKNGRMEKNGTVPGLHVKYEEPTKPELVIESNILTPDKAVDKILELIDKYIKLEKHKNSGGC